MQTLDELKKEIDTLNKENDNYRKQVKELFNENKTKIINAIINKEFYIKLGYVNKNYANIIKEEFVKFGYDIELYDRKNFDFTTLVILWFNRNTINQPIID